MPSFYLDPTQFLTPEELERAIANSKATEQLQAALVAEQEKAKSNGGGPRTAEGKAISSRNALKHGFAGSNPVISIEDRGAYLAHLDSYYLRFQPADQPEYDAVRRAAIAMWRCDRLYALEAILFDLEMDYHSIPSACILPPDASPFTRAAVVFKESAGDRAYDLCRRYIIAATREHDRAIRTFYLLESKRRPHTTSAIAAVADLAPAASVTVIVEESKAAQSSEPPPPPPPQQQPQSQKTSEPNELLKMRSRSTVESLVNPFLPSQPTRKPAATASVRRESDPKAA